MMLFGGKRGDEVRVLTIGSSKEPCGGTYVARTGDLWLLRIVAAGVRLAGAAAMRNGKGPRGGLEILS